MVQCGEDGEMEKKEVGDVGGFFSPLAGRFLLHLNSLGFLNVHLTTMIMVIGGNEDVDDDDDDGNEDVDDDDGGNDDGDDHNW